MTSDEQTIDGFYACLKRNDWAGMAGCYCDDATFLDMAFDLKGRKNIADMWRFECSRGLKVEYGNIRTEGYKVLGHWTCDYKFHGEYDVHNEIDSTFTLRDGKILTHVDEASRWRWARQALGFPKDVVVTVAPFLLRLQAKKELQAFLDREEAERSR